MKHRLFLFVATCALMSTGAWGQDADRDDLAKDRNLIQGTWSVVAYDQDGQALPPEIILKMKVTIQAEGLTISPKVVAQRTPSFKDGKSDVKFTLEEGKSDEAKYRLDVTKKQKVIELTQELGSGQARKIKGAYSLGGDSVTICFPLPDQKLPKKIPDSPKAGVVRMVLKRVVASAPGVAPSDGK